MQKPDVKNGHHVVILDDIQQQKNQIGFLPQPILMAHINYKASGGSKRVTTAKPYYPYIFHGGYKYNITINLQLYTYSLPYFNNKKV